MEWEGDEGNELVPTWSCNPVSTRQKPRSASHIQTPIECTRALWEFYMYAQYKSHDDATLSYMEDALHRFHTYKDVLFLRRAGKKAKAKANALRTELLKKRKVHEETNAETWMVSKKRRQMNTCRDYISHGIDVSQEFDADFTCSKIHLMCHWVKQIRR